MQSDPYGLQLTAACLDPSNDCRCLSQPPSLNNRKPVCIVPSFDTFLLLHKHKRFICVALMSYIFTPVIHYRYKSA